VAGINIAKRGQYDVAGINIAKRGQYDVAGINIAKRGQYGRFMLYPFILIKFDF
jgi:hypothetical protein